MYIATIRATIKELLAFDRILVTIVIILYTSNKIIKYSIV